MDCISDNKIDQLQQLCAAGRQVAIVVHQHPDGDALGSATALYLYLNEQANLSLSSANHAAYPDQETIPEGYGTSPKGQCSINSKPIIQIIVPDSYPHSLDFIVEDIDILNADTQPDQAAKYLETCDLLFCLDFNTLARSASLESRLRTLNCPKVLIDHHPNPDTQDFNIIISEPERSSTCELLYEVLRRLQAANAAASGNAASDAGRVKVGVSKTVADALMTGMTTDTNNFANSTAPSTLRMAAELLECGAGRDAILEQLYSSFRENRLRLMGYMLHKLLTITPDGIAYAIIDAKTAAQFALEDGETEGFVNIGLGIARVKASLLLKEDEGHFRVSVRSKEGFDCTAFTREYFHGGGHVRASGGRLFFPEDIASPEYAAQYIENVSARFLHKDAPAK